MRLTFFFFSSRRRHTRSLRDWSSDVCSSDLPPPRPPAAGAAGRGGAGTSPGRRGPPARAGGDGGGVFGREPVVRRGTATELDRHGRPEPRGRWVAAVRTDG